MSRNHTYNDQYYDEDESDEYEQEMHQVNQQYRLRHKNNKNNNNNMQYEDEDQQQQSNANGDMEEYYNDQNDEQQLMESTTSTAPTIKPIFQSELLKMKFVILSLWVVIINVISQWNQQL